jgi:hypothetical protein
MASEPDAELEAFDPDDEDLLRDPDDDEDGPIIDVEPEGGHSYGE